MPWNACSAGGQPTGVIQVLLFAFADVRPTSSLGIIENIICIRKYALDRMEGSNLMFRSRCRSAHVLDDMGAQRSIYYQTWGREAFDLWSPSQWHRPTPQ